MKIVTIHAFPKYTDDNIPLGTTLELTVKHPGGVEIAIRDVLALFSGTPCASPKTSEVTLPSALGNVVLQATDPAALAATAKMFAEVADAPVVAEAVAKASRRRREIAPAAVVEQPTDQNVGQQELAAASTPVEGRRRRRDVAPAEVVVVETKPTITDFDLTKAASAAAAIIGANCVKDILGELKAATVNDLVGDDRQKFIDELNKEIEIVRLEQAEKKG